MKRGLGILAVAAVVTASIAGAAVATPPSGIVTAPIIGRGHFTDDVQMKFKLKRHGTKSIKVSLRDPSEVVAQQITLAPRRPHGLAYASRTRGGGGEVGDHDADDGRPGVLDT